jgi:hypothetical protein
MSGAWANAGVEGTRQKNQLDAPALESFLKQFMILWSETQKPGLKAKQLLHPVRSTKL